MFYHFFLIPKYIEINFNSFDAHGGFSHAVIDGWVVCQEHEETVLAAYQEEEVRNNLKMIAKQQERVWGNWKRIIKSLQIREHLKFKYGTENTDGYKKTVGLNEINVTDNEDDIGIISWHIIIFS